MKYLSLLLLLFAELSEANILFSGKGQVADIPVEMHLKIDDRGNIKGHYLYTRIGTPIPLSGGMEAQGSWRKIKLETTAPPSDREKFTGSAYINYSKGIAEIQGKWESPHAGKGNFHVKNTAPEPLADMMISCEEMATMPEKIFGAIQDLGSGHSSPVKVDYNCPDSLASLDFIKPLLGSANQINGNNQQTALPPICTGSGRYASWRYFYFSLAELGYYPSQYVSRYDEKKNRVENRQNEYFEEWSYRSLYNRDTYLDYKNDERAAKPKLITWYQGKHGLSASRAKRYADIALKEIGGRAYGSYPHYWNPEPLIPFTDQAVKENYTNFLLHSEKSSDEQKTNSLRRIIMHDADPWVVKKLARSVDATSEGRKSETLLSIAVRNPEILEILLDSNFDPNHSNSFGKTPLFYAIQFGPIESAKVLLGKGADANYGYQWSRDYSREKKCSTIKHWGRTPLMHAAQHSNPSVMMLLLKNGAQLNARDELGNTALDYANRNDNPENAEFLLREAEQYLNKNQP